MYTINQDTALNFITDRNIRLPRFQRKQTWDAKKNFQLCVSVFKGYPLGVCIINTEIVNNKQRRFLLDGRQRRNALSLMYENPENIGLWAIKFMGKIRGGDDITELFYDKINEYLESDDEDEDTAPLSESDDEDVNTDGAEENEEYPEELDEETAVVGAGGLEFLLNIITLTYKKSKHATGFSAPFDFVKYMDNLPYRDSDPKNEYVLNGKKVKTFIDEYIVDCENNDIDDSNDPDIFVDFLLSRAKVKDNSDSKLRKFIKRKWNEIYSRIEIVIKLDALMRQCKIGLIEVKGFKPADSQKIFNIINSEGVKLTAVEILSAKTYWNNKVSNPSADMLECAKDLYSNMNIKIDDVYRWDIPATLLARLGGNVIFKNLSWDSANKKTEFEKKLTLGFKVFAGIYEKGIKKEDIDNMGKNANINWDQQSEPTIGNLSNVIKLIEQTSYFQFLKSWRISIMELTSDAIALDFLLILYFDWIRKGSPLGTSTKMTQFQKNCFILWDQLIYEYVRKQWRGSSDSKIAVNIKMVTENKLPEVFKPLDKDKWMSLLDEIQKTSKVDDTDVSVAIMKPILYHMYCLKEISGPGTDCSIEVDHIIPQASFKSSSTIPNKKAVQDNLFNLGLLPKKDNISKSNLKLTAIDDGWLKSQIKTYEFIEESQYKDFSSEKNYQKLFDFKRKAYDEAFDKKRDAIL